MRGRQMWRKLCSTSLIVPLRIRRSYTTGEANEYSDTDSEPVIMIDLYYTSLNKKPKLYLSPALGGYAKLLI